MRIPRRIVLSVLIAVIALAGMLTFDNWAAFSVNRNKQPLDLNELTISDVKKGRAVYGDCVLVYDLIGYGYTEETNKYTSSKKTHTDTYYWAIDCGDNDIMLVKTSASKVESDWMQELVDLYWESETWDDFKANHPGSVTLDGVFIANDSEIVSFYNEWIADMRSSSDEWKDVQLAPYTLDCCNTLQTRINRFYIGVGLFAVLIIVGIIAIVVIAKGAKGGPVIQAQGTIAGNYGAMNGSSYDTYGANNTANSFNTAYGTQNGYQAQGGSAYGTQSGYQSQGGSAYGTQGGFQAQGGSTYGTQGGYQSQSGSTYGTQSGYQSQSGSTYGAQDTSASQSGTVGGYQGQSGINYGSSVQGGVNYGSTAGTSSSVSLDKNDR